MRTLPLSGCLLIAAASAQDAAGEPAQESRSAAALRQRLLAAAASDGVAFEARWRWRPPEPPAKAVGGGVVRVRAAAAEHVASGVCRRGALEVCLPTTPPRELLVVGRRAIAREVGGKWQLQGLRSSELGPFVPDPTLLLHALGQTVEHVLDRSIGEQDGVAVERFAVALDEAAVEALVAAGALPAPDEHAYELRRVLRGSKYEQYLPAPPIVDVAFEFDVATRSLRRLHVRALVEPFDFSALERRPAGAPPGGGGRNDGPGRADRADRDAAREPRRPRSFVRGMPVRSSDGLRVQELVVELRDHGAVPPLALDAAQRRLLGR